jgi:hypothetical protein
MAITLVRNCAGFRAVNGILYNDHLNRSRRWVNRRAVSRSGFMREQFRKLLIRQTVWMTLAILSGPMVITARGAPARTLPSQAGTPFAIADFDGDNRPDLASIDTEQSNARSTHYWIAVHLSGGSGQIFGITAPTGGVLVTSRDVNGDSFPDVIVTTAWTNKPVVVLLNDGFGNFTASNPSKFRSALTASETSWTFAGEEVRDTSVLWVWRCVSGDCRPEDRSWSLAAAIRLPATTSTTASWSLSLLPFVGRAPPS